MTPEILAFAGSTRKGSFNAKLVQIAGRGATNAGAKVTIISLADFDLPIYNADLEAAAGIPDAAKRLKQLITKHSGLLIATPEYNGAMTPLLLNAISWASRPEGDEGVAAVFKGKMVALVSASPARLGGMRSIAAVSSLLGGIGSIVLPYPVAVSQAATAFDANGTLVDKALEKRVEGVGASLASWLQRLKS